MHARPARRPRRDGLCRASLGVFAKSQIPAAYRWVLLAGGMGAYLLFLVIGLFVGGVV